MNTGRNINTGPISNLCCLELARMMSLKIGHIVCDSFNFHNIYCKSKIFYGCRLQSLQTSEVEFWPTVPWNGLVLSLWKSWRSWILLLDTPLYLVCCKTTTKEALINQSTNRRRNKLDDNAYWLRKLSGKWKIMWLPITPRPNAIWEKRVGASAMLINRLIHGHLDKKLLKKTKVHALTPAAIEKRKIRALPFYNLINNRQFEFILTIDEAWLPYTMKNGKRDFYYDAKTVGERREDPPLTMPSPSHPQKRMFAAGYSWRGPTRFYVVEDKAKVNGEYFLEHILKAHDARGCSCTLRRGCGTKWSCTWTALLPHTKKIVYNWLNSRGFKFFTKDQWLANSPEVSPMDFFANGYFKSELQKRKFRSVTGMIKAAKQVWSEIPLKMFQESLEFMACPCFGNSWGPWWSCSGVQKVKLFKQNFVQIFEIGPVLMLRPVEDVLGFLRRVLVNRWCVTVLPVNLSAVLVYSRFSWA